MLVAATASLREAGIETPRLDAEVLLASVLDENRTTLAIHPERTVPSAVAAAFETTIHRRIAGDPVAYLTGQREFMGHAFAVGPGVLVPRPETENLVEWAVEQVDRLWPASPVRLLDVGTGSGSIAISIALALPEHRAQITGSDISEKALAYAIRNRCRHGLDRRIHLVRGDLLSWTRGPWDMVIANLPYLRPDQIEENPDLGAEPRSALDGGSAGLDLIERLLDRLPSIAAPTFAMALEIDPSQTETVEQMTYQRLPDGDVQILDDLSGRARFVTFTRSEQAS